MMRITLRLILSLVVAAMAVVFVSAVVQTRQERVRLREELDRRAAALAESLQESVEARLGPEDLQELGRMIRRFRERERLVGVAVYAADGRPLAMTENLPAPFGVFSEDVREALRTPGGRGWFLQDGRTWWHVQAVPLHRAAAVAGGLVVVQDAGSLEVRCAALWRENFVRLLLHVLLISLTTLLIVQWSLLRPLSKTVEWMRRLRTGELPEAGVLPKGELFAPLAREVRRMAKSLLAARVAAAEEARLRNAAESRWTADRLKEHVRRVLKGRPLLVVSNREPYIHVRDGWQVRCVVPPGGLVTAMEPILRACGGTWIAYGSGNADHDVVDAHGRLPVPPETPLYTLKRVWLTTDEERGYYYGFANEGLWPLCHIAHTRPLFRLGDWEQYARVNAKFADAVLEELAGMDQPCLLIQDYHLALLPRLIKARCPQAKIALFWHIPWPNPEAFGICPWARELLHGMLGADLIGFHIQFHCNNFLDTVDRMLESRIDREQFSITRADQTTWVKPFPISVAGSPPSTEAEGQAAGAQAREEVVAKLGLSVRWLGVGVDRLDYTKGLIERFLAVERFFEKYPAFQEQFTFVELAAPSRTLIKRYQELVAAVEAEAERINRRFQTRAWKPIVLLEGQHSHEEIAPFYRAADVCLVTSLHDGMNLVSKEFVASRDDKTGALILSQFAGASRELRDALLVNPYDLDQVAEAIHDALTMELDEQRARMARMREVVQEHNVYRWAASLVTTLTALRPSTDGAAPPADASGA